MEKVKEEKGGRIRKRSRIRSRSSSMVTSRNRSRRYKTFFYFTCCS